MSKEELRKVEQEREKLSLTLQTILESSRYLLKPLESLTPQQKSCIALLLRLDAVARLARRPEYHTDDSYFRAYYAALDGMLPASSKARSGGDPCLEYSIAYASALASCGEDQRPTGPGPRDEDECFEAWGPMAQSIACTMAQLEGLKHDIGDLFQHLTPPIPPPWDPIPLPRNL
jgi:hypothetical protein